MRPMPVVTSASATPPVIACSDWPPPEAAMPWKALTTPNTVPSSPTNGAVAPVVARIDRPRFSSEVMMSICRSTARSAELMSPAVMVARSRSSGFTSASASPSTRATWLFLLFSASLIAESSCSSCSERENSGPNLRVSFCALRRYDHFCTAMVHEISDISTITMTIIRANRPIEFHRSIKLIREALLAALGLAVALDLEVNRDRDEHADGAAVHPARAVQRLQDDVFRRLIEAGVGALGHAHRIGLDPPARVDDRVHHHAPLDPRLLQQRRGHPRA